MNLYCNDKACFIAALNDWADNLNYKKWIKKYPVRKIIKDDLLFMNKMEWLVKNNIKHTPVIYLNNRELPIFYQVDDLDVLLMNEDIVAIIAANR